jgi:hypothetical protein
MITNIYALGATKTKGRNHMVIMQIVGMFQCENEEKGQELAHKLGEMLTAATADIKGTIYAQVAPQADTEGILEHANKLVAEHRKQAN